MRLYCRRLGVDGGAMDRLTLSRVSSCEPFLFFLKFFFLTFMFSLGKQIATSDEPWMLEESEKMSDCGIGAGYGVRVYHDKLYVHLF